MLSVLAGHRRYAHITALRCDPVYSPRARDEQVVSEDAVRRALARSMERLLGGPGCSSSSTIAPAAVEPSHGYLTSDTTVKPLYGHQEGAVLGYNPKKPGRPSHTYHSYMMANLRLVLEVEVASGQRARGEAFVARTVGALGSLGPQCSPGCCVAIGLGATRV